MAGGVSSWVYQLIKEFHDLTFAVVYLGPHRSSQRRLHYEIPNNVVDLREFYLFDYRVEQNKKDRPKDWKIVEEFLVKLKAGDPSNFDDIYRVVGDPRTRSISLHDLVYSPEIWEIVKKLYYMEEQESSFVDYFWTWRFIHLPFFSLLRVELPKAKVYHSASTGYAGVIGSLCQLRYKRPFILTEHGIYTRERKIEISRADWIYSEAAQDIKVGERQDIFRDWWINFFSYFSRLTYDRADSIITLFEGNRRIQVEEGANPAKISIVPNGVDFERFAGLPRAEKDDTFRIGFVGRVVPIKDVKTFIIACRRIRDELKNVEVYILGPTDEDEEYYKECVLLTKMEGMDDVIRFMGKVNMQDYYRMLDIVVLTSLSEAQPLVILEAQACGIPVVATEVGACEELLNGRAADDRLLGQSGMTVPIYDPEKIARAVIEILKNPERKKMMGHIGQQRVRTYYEQDDFIASYQNLYANYIDQVRW